MLARIGAMEIYLPQSRRRHRTTVFIVNFEHVFNCWVWCFIFQSFLYERRTSRSETFLAIESPLKMMKNGFYFTSKALFVLKIFQFLSWLFGHVAKRLDKKDKVNFKFYDVTAWLANSHNTHIAQCFAK